MFFCPNCNNIFDITRTKSQTGGGDGLGLMWEDSSMSSESIPLSSSDFLEGGGSYTTLINKLINDQIVTSDDLKNINIKELFKNPEYMKLKSEQKEYIYNKIQDLLPKEKKRAMKDKPEKYKEEDITYFVCTNCKYAKKIEDGTLIFSRTTDMISKTLTTDMTDMIYSDILPRTRKYICPNKNCPSHEDPIKREAIFYRTINSYKLTYLCTACKTEF